MIRHRDEAEFLGVAADLTTDSGFAVAVAMGFGIGDWDSAPAVCVRGDSSTRSQDAAVRAVAPPTDCCASVKFSATTGASRSTCSQNRD